jgi:protein-tyrosine phosphatase
LNGVYWIYGNASTPPLPKQPAPEMLSPMPLAVVLCPRGGRYLADELSHLKSAGIQTLVSLLSEDQVDLLDLTEEPMLVKRLGMRFLHHPIPDHELPPDEHAFRMFVSDLARRLRAGERIGIHCWGSIGRATVTAACTLIHLGWMPPAALAAVEAARGCPVPDTEEQEQWILHYKAQV